MFMSMLWSCHYTGTQTETYQQNCVIDLPRFVARRARLKTHNLTFVA